MKITTILTFIIFIIGVFVHNSCAQTNSCPTNNEKAEQELKEYLTKERNIQSLRDQYGMAIKNNARENIQSLSKEKDGEECRQLRLNLDWIEDQKHYSIYKVANHYFIVLYSFTKEDEFQMNSIPIVNSEFKAVGSIISFD